jgi:hypothetical protein
VAGEFVVAIGLSDGRFTRSTDAIAALVQLGSFAVLQTAQDDSVWTGAKPLGSGGWVLGGEKRLNAETQKTQRRRREAASD